MRGMIGGMFVGGLVSVIGLGTASIVAEQPAGTTPPDAPLVEAPEVNAAPDVSAVDPVVAPAENTAEGTSPAAVSSPVGSISIDEPLAPAVPDGDGDTDAQSSPAQSSPTQSAPEAAAPRADTDPLDEPEIATLDEAMQAPDASDDVGFFADPVEPVLPNPQSQAPVTPNSEANLTVSTAPAQPVVVNEPVVEDSFVVDLGPVTSEDEDSPEGEDVSAGEDGSNAPIESDDVPQDTQQDAMENVVIAEVSPDAEEPEVEAPVAQVPDVVDQAEPDAPLLQLQGDENALLADRETGVTIRRPSNDASAEVTDETGADDAPVNALEDYAATVDDFGITPLLSIILIDDGSMASAAAALAGLPFDVTIALDPATPNVADMMTRYRADGYEIAVLAKLPEGAVPSDVEVSFESVFGTLPETIAMLDIGEGGLQAERAVTIQAMNILASQGRGFITASQGLNMAGRAAEAVGVPSAVIYRDLDFDGQDARVIRRFIDQAAFRARQNSGVVLVGRVRPDTISALILWGTANQEGQIALVPVSAVLNAQ